MKYYLNDNVELVKIKTVWLLSNFDNQSVIGLDSKGVQFWENVKKGGVSEQEIEENRELYESLFELEFILKEEKNKEDGVSISSAYVHLLNRCNLNCLGCYSINDGRNMEHDAATDKWKLGFKRLEQAGVNTIAVSVDGYDTSKANIYDFIIGQDKSFDTYIGEKGSLLSGGQKQRIAIARMFLRNPAILLLDEIAANLDAKSEEQVSRSLENLYKERITLIIAHKLSTVMDADRILVLQDGYIVGNGSHKELMKTNQYYQKVIKYELKR